MFGSREIHFGIGSQYGTVPVNPASLACAAIPTGFEASVRAVSTKLAARTWGALAALRRRDFPLGSGPTQTHTRVSCADRSFCPPCICPKRFSPPWYGSAPSLARLTAFQTQGRNKNPRMAAVRRAQTGKQARFLLSAAARPRSSARPGRLRFRSLPPTQSGKLVLGRGGGPGAWGLVPPPVRAARGYGGGRLWQDPGAFDRRSGAGLHWF